MPKNYVSVFGSGGDVLPAGAAFSPSDVAGLKLWLKSEGSYFQDNPPTVAATADGDLVKYWTDSSGQANHPVANSDAARATLKLAIQNGKNIIRFQGTNAILHKIFAAPLPQPNWIFIVFKSANEGRIIDGDTSGRHILDGTAGAWRYYAGTSQSGGTDDTTTWHYNTGNFNGASSYLRVNGSVVTSANPGSNTFDGIYIGSDNSEAGLWSGDMAEVLVYNANLTTTDRDNIEAYLAAKFAL